MKKGHNTVTVTPERLAALKQEAFMTPQERGAKFLESMAVPVDQAAAQRETNGAYSAHLAAERRARRVHAAKRIATLGIVRPYHEHQRAQRERTAAQEASVRAAERAALEADPEYLAVMGARYQNDFERAAAKDLLTTSAHGYELRRAVRQMQFAKEADAAGDTDRAAMHRDFAIVSQNEALKTMSGHVDNARKRDFGLGRPYDVATPAETMAGLHTLALEENRQRQDLNPPVLPHAGVRP